MSSRTQGRTQAQASAQAEMSERAGQRIDSGRISALAQKERHWRTRKDPFSAVWDNEIVPLLEKQPGIEREARGRGNTQPLADVSSTAEPFFRRVGFSIVRRQIKIDHNRAFKQAVMEKRDWRKAGMNPS